MDIKPWDRNLQEIGIELNRVWNECESHFFEVFRDNDALADERIDEAHFHTVISMTLAHCIIGKEEGVDRYFKDSGSVIQLLKTISNSVQEDSFDSNEEYHWFNARLDEITVSLSSFELPTRGLASNRYSGADERNVLYAFLSFHSKLKELCKYTLLRMDVKRVQRKLVERALSRIDEQLWKSIQSAGRSSIIYFFRQSKIRLKNLNNLRDVQCVNHRLEEGIIYADKAYSPQKKKSKGNISLQVVYSLNIDLGDNDIISGHFSLDRNLEGFIATDNTVAECPIIIAYKGTDVWNGADRSTDIVQALTCANDVYLMALGLLLYVRDTVGCSRTVRVYGHSLGGGLMQFAVSSAPSGRIYGYGYNSAGLSIGTMRLIPQPMHIDKIRHFRLRNDWVMATGEQIGVIEQYAQPQYNRLSAHFCSKIRKVLNQENVFVNIV